MSGDMGPVPDPKTFLLSHFRFISIRTAKTCSWDKSKMTLMVFFNDARCGASPSSRHGNTGELLLLLLLIVGRTQVHSGRRLSIIHALSASHTNLLTMDDGGTPLQYPKTRSTWLITECCYTVS